MNWTTPADIGSQVLRLWDRGILARAAFSAEPIPALPIRLKLSVPSSQELSDQFEQVRAWIAQLQSISALRIEWRETQHRVLGLQRIPQAIWLDDFSASVLLINKQKDAAHLQQVINQTSAALPVLMPWILANPAGAIALALKWPKLLAVVQWRAANPMPKIYLRQVDIPGVHSKFIENHRGALTALFELALGASDRPGPVESGETFATRFGFLERPTRIRFRALDGRFSLIKGTVRVDFKLDAENFALLDWGQYVTSIKHVFITENEINFLTFPDVANALVVFGAGYGWEALAKARWLHTCSLHYWGDLDTHGFAILHQLRHYFPQVNSLLMDHATLVQHKSVWGFEANQSKGNLSRLNAEETGLYNLLRDNRLGQGVRLEQEHIGFDWVKAAVRAAIDLEANLAGAQSEK